MKILLLLMLLLPNCTASADGEIYLIPKGYTGIIVIFYAQPNGKDIIKEGKSRLLEISKNGTLYTKFKANKGVMSISDTKFFYVDDQKNRTPITFDPENKFPKDSTPAIFALKDGFIETEKTGEVRFTAFIIGSFNNMAKYPDFNPLKIFNDSK